MAEPERRAIGALNGRYMMRWAIISSTCEVGQEHPTRLRTIWTVHGPVRYRLNRCGANEVITVVRGQNRRVCPHRVNHRANMEALKRLGVDAVISTSMVGSLSSDLPPLTIVLPHQLIDFARHTSPLLRQRRYREIDVTVPFDEDVRQAAHAALNRELPNADVRSGCYVNIDGPRFETAAEIRMFHQLGGTIIGMTIGAEALCARASGLPYATISGVVNYGAGLRASTHLTRAEHLAHRATLLTQLGPVLTALTSSTLPHHTELADETDTIQQALIDSAIPPTLAIRL
ncbi:MTAP family purine nucleoside phosphorylase (plasmid) [Leifsonia sp. ZF2019]|uniref:MTAP family purine nucleoside phosphorylase n=1 Tax=Leifsonia sp. ZF2019 TaxID=2781978 RepID=UPI0023775F35|nr:MTAP family purine nucleoside phosphorylase [Leifsonia sp. ZF2019]